MWYYEHIGGKRCPVVDTWWQTETGQILIAPLPGSDADEAGLGDETVPGIAAEIVNERGEKIERRRRLSRADAAVAGDAANHLRRF